MSDKKTHWPFGSFFLKLSDEKNGTHEYENYLKECEEEIGRASCRERV